MNKSNSFILFLIALALLFGSCGSLCAAAEQEAAAAVVPQEAASQNNVTFDFKDADIQNVLKIISYKSGVNIISSPDVTGAVTIRLVDVPWEKALDAILTAHSFGYEWLNDKIIMVTTLDKINQKKKLKFDELTQQKKVELEQKKAEIEQKKANMQIDAQKKKEAVEAIPLDTKAFVLNFSKAEDIKAAIQNLVSTRGKIMLESRTNTLIVTDTRQSLSKIAGIIKSLDRATPQVAIEAKIIETTLGTSEKLGIDWSLRASLKGSQRPVTFPFRTASSNLGQSYLPQIQTPSSLERVTLTQQSETGTVLNTSTTEQLFHRLAAGFPVVSEDLFTFGTLDFTEFQAILEILNQRTNTKVLSNPRIVTLNNREAKIIVGSVVPIPTYEYSKDTGTRVVSGYIDQEIGVGLTVTPNINDKDYITLNVRPTIDQIIGYTGPNNERPIISTRNAETNVMIKDGQTLVIGGLIAEKKTNFKKKVPILGDIPGLDKIFSKKEDTIDRTELLVFISPHIVRDKDFRTADYAETKQIEDTMIAEAKKTIQNDGK